MSRVSLRALLAAFLSLSFVGGLLLPGEHLHVNDDDHDRRETVIHRHAAPHQSPEKTGAFDHPEGAPHWLEGVLAGPAAGPQLPNPDVFIVEDAFAADLAGVVAGVNPASTPPVHGPPLIPVGCRAPPLGFLS